MADWTGNSVSVFKTLSASNHCGMDRAEHDYYATDPVADEWFLKIEPELADTIWECACGENSISEVFRRNGKSVRCSDLVVRQEGIEQLDFLLCTEPMHGADIVTNPPFKYAEEFVEKALSLVDDGRYVCMFLKLIFLEGKSRRSLFEKHPPVRVWVSSSRIRCVPNGDFSSKESSAGCYAWFVWKKGHSGETAIRWFN